MKDYYDLLFKRKSVREYDGNLTENDIQIIQDEIKELTPLVEGIRVETKLVPRTETTAKIGEYCLLIYTEDKEFAMMNVGYMFEQLDLALMSHDIGVCWYGMGKAEEKNLNDLKFAIMLTIGKAKHEDYRSSLLDFKRKEIYEIWEGDFNQAVKEAVRVAPSAVNLQPWKFRSSLNKVAVFHNPNLMAKLVASMSTHFSLLDIGIVLCFFEIALTNKGFTFERELLSKNKSNQIAIYTIK